MRKILSVDDEPAVLRCFERALRTKGYAVFVTSDPTTVPQLLKDNEFDLIMLDIMMPGKSGLDIFKELKGKYDHLPVLFVTAHAQTFSMESQEMMKLWEEQFADGNTDILYKPIQLEMLYEKVEGLIGPAATRGTG